ncbi:UDP-Glycosyltransferase/glycogen phosphorylase [Dacryopinax primogenitus]|uniref:UDP-Glycosyltransferase/glycogen phosphorylase n=1 Tax=Dacryopinax primogenitus (strain DJM 731) TaxID=1858805 RepID=M5G189_DACPD|nr:UDP-Glycosyltransferase/glycogen phosphorylase [Dacryopinax primogenitus]EJU01950.1 UDP-Glycosyltransferase/glycogen phosphorylase [Dacryopinax primogenitus]
MGDAPTEVGQQQQGHFLFFSWLGWGHIRAESAFGVTVARKFPRLTITRITQITYTEKIKSELYRQCTEEERETILPRIRVVGLGKPLQHGPSHEQHVEMMKADNFGGRITGVLESIMHDREFTDDAGVVIPPVGGTPGLMISDILMGEVALPAMETYKIPTMVWFFGSCATSLTRFIAPRAYGGQMEWEDEVEAAFANPDIAKGRSIVDISYEYAEHTPHWGDVVHVRGLEDTYQWENHPQKLWPHMTWDLRRTLVKLYHSVQGIIVRTTRLLEPEGLAGLEEFYCTNKDRVVIATGPLLPAHYFELPTAHLSSFSGLEVSYIHPASSTGDSSPPAAREQDPCLTFLDIVLREHGPQSSIFISFGTIHTPSVPRAYLEVLVDILLSLENSMPFILSMASPDLLSSLLPPSLLERVETSGRGMIVQWAPQQAIFAHPALGWVLTHGGGNTTLEALGKGLPMICWPIWGDQPVNCLWVSRTLRAGFELLEIRTAGAGRRAWRRGEEGQEIEGSLESVRREMERVFRLAKGEEGAVRRRNARRAREMLVRSVQQGGDVDVELEKLARYF